MGDSEARARTRQLRMPFRRRYKNRDTTDPLTWSPNPHHKKCKGNKKENDLIDILRGIEEQLEAEKQAQGGQAEKAVKGLAVKCQDDEVDGDYDFVYEYAE